MAARDPKSTAPGRSPRRSAPPKAQRESNSPALGKPAPQNRCTPKLPQSRPEKNTVAPPTSTSAASTAAARNIQLAQGRQRPPPFSAQCPAAVAAPPVAPTRESPQAALRSPSVSLLKISSFVSVFSVLSAPSAVKSLLNPNRK